ncbi:hypothetical protein SAMN04487820_101338 [Actinopolyspora mzabensis]|uniref:Uncharacterized protein n=1 Tax=Actinopolyspora mzabensis TaxID=995066 RepID=A0A1G8VV10_ACTMZ|nr:hypothetical protein [Actinopolyspora mzabensis]SDJ69647.1 hypothetical protein SAMN04487820_101338 [Actinopolyspora mzabensis]
MPELVRDGFAKAALHRPNDKHGNTISGARPGDPHRLDSDGDGIGREG